MLAFRMKSKISAHQNVTKYVKKTKPKNELNPKKYMQVAHKLLKQKTPHSNKQIEYSPHKTNA